MLSLFVYFLDPISEWEHLMFVLKYMQTINEDKEYNYVYHLNIRKAEKVLFVPVNS